MRRLIARLERIEPPPLSDMQFIGICLACVVATLAVVFFGSTTQ